MARYRNTGRLSLFGGNEGKAMLVGGVLAASVVGLFGYFYGREWYLNRRLRSYKIGTGSNEVLPTPGPDKTARKPLVNNGAIASNSGADLSGMCDRSRRKESKGQIHPVWTASNPAQSTPLTGTASAGYGRGTLKISAEGDSAEIYINGEFVGMTPAKLNLAEGNHLVELRAVDGRHRYRREIRIMNGAEANLQPVWADHDTGDGKSLGHTAKVWIA